MTPPDCDLRDFPYMPLDVVRLRDSETAVILNGDEFRAAIILWCASWHQVPAGSLPNDERLLASLAGLGGSSRKWKAVRSGALRGFVECRDGRLYHPTVCEKVIEAIAKRNEQRSKTSAARAARASKRDEQPEKDNNINEGAFCDRRDKDISTDNVSITPTETKGREGKGIEGKGIEGKGIEGKGIEGREDIGDDGRSAHGETKKKPKQIPEAMLIEAGVGPLWKQFCDAYRGPIGKTAEGRFRSLLAAGENADPIIAAAPRANPDMPAEQWLDERAWAQLSLPTVAAPTEPLISEGATLLANEIAQIAGQDLEFLEPGWCGAAMRCQMWLTQGWPRELIVAGVRAQVAKMAPEKINNVNYFDKGLARFIAQQTRPVPQVIERQAETVEVIRGKTAAASDPRSGIAAIDRVYNRIEQMQRGDCAALPAAPIQRLPS